MYFILELYSHTDFQWRNFVPVCSFVKILTFRDPRVIKHVRRNSAWNSRLAVSDHRVDKYLWECKRPWRQTLDQSCAFVELKPRYKVLTNHLVHNKISGRQALQYTIRCFFGSLAHCIQNHLPFGRQIHVSFISNQIDFVASKWVIRL